MPDVTCKVCDCEFWVADGTDEGTECVCTACEAKGTLQKIENDWVLEPGIE